MNKRATRPIRTSISALSLLFLFTGASKCSSSDLSDPLACRQLIEEQTERFESARLALGPWRQEIHDARASRGLASIKLSAPIQVEEPHLSVQDRRDWGKWARLRLFEVENSIDVMPVTDEYKPARTKLSLLAKDVVQFHAYVEKGKVSKMLAILDRLKSTSLEIAPLACRQPSSRTPDVAQGKASVETSTSKKR